MTHPCNTQQLLTIAFKIVDRKVLKPIFAFSNGFTMFFQSTFLPIVLFVCLMCFVNSKPSSSGCRHHFFFDYELGTCKPCHLQCSICTSFGTSIIMNECHCRNSAFRNSTDLICVDNCFTQKEESGESACTEWNRLSVSEQVEFAQNKENQETVSFALTEAKLLMLLSAILLCCCFCCYP